MSERPFIKIKPFLSCLQSLINKKNKPADKKIRLPSLFPENTVKGKQLSTHPSTESAPFPFFLLVFEGKKHVNNHHFAPEIRLWSAI
jgi:hypothetical protein